MGSSFSSPSQSGVLLLKKLLFGSAAVSTHDSKASVALLLLRLAAGIGMCLHGFGKIQAPFDWMGPDAPVPGILQFLAALSEFVGGIAWIIGLLTPLASLGMAITMVVATFVHVSKGDPFVQGYELALLYLCISIIFMILGPGKFAVDPIIGRKR